MNVLRLDMFKNTEIIDGFICEICQGVFRDPVVNAAGVTFCKPCVEANPQSPVVFPNGTPTPIANMTKNLIIKKFIEEQEVKCMNYKESCAWQGIVEKLEEHGRTCVFALVPCTHKGCKLTIIRSKAEEHKSECPKKPVKCPDCKADIPGDEMSIHSAECPKSIIKCKLGCHDEFYREAEKAHYADICRHRLSSCAYCDAGCLFQGKDFEQELHIKQFLNYHMRLQGEKILSQENFFSDSLTSLLDTILNTDDQEAKLKAYKDNLREYLKRNVPVQLTFDPSYASNHLVLSDNRREANLTSTTETQVLSTDRTLQFFERLVLQIQKPNPEAGSNSKMAFGVLNAKPLNENWPGVLKEPTSRFVFITSGNHLYRKSSAEPLEEPANVDFKIEHNDLLSLYLIPDANTIVFENLTHSQKVEFEMDTQSLAWHPFIMIGPQLRVVLKDYIEQN